MRAIGSPLDFVGINVYRPNRYVEPSEEPPGCRTIPISASHPKMKSGWRIFDPEIMYWVPRGVRALFDARSICITENGCAAEGGRAADGRVYDTDRVMFLRACLGQLQRAAAEGVPVDGYFHWSAQDNLEWNAGSVPSGSGRRRGGTRWCERRAL